MKNQKHELKFNLGQNLDVKDQMNKWINGQIIFIKLQQIYIHYSGWSSKFDQYISLDSDRFLTQWQPGKTIAINNRIDAYHPYSGWLQARVIDIQYQKIEGHQKIKKILVHYFNYHPKYDRWIDYQNPNEMAIIGSKTKAYGIGKSRKNMIKNKSNLSQKIKKILEIKRKKMLQQLNNNDFVMVDVGGDGNCLFRSVSHQLYGTQDYHKQIRMLCMGYIRRQHVFFQDYVTQDIFQYVKNKQNDGIWGDDVEIQAISQIYSRPIQIYATSSKPLRTFHEDSQKNIQPLKLAYVGYCHYNSIKNKQLINSGLMNTPFGQYQALFLSTYQNQLFHKNQINKYRQFFSNTNGINQTLSQNVDAQGKQQDTFSQLFLQIQMNEIIKKSQTDHIVQQIQKSQMQIIQKQIQKQQIQQQIRKIQERQLQIAKQLSKKVKKDPQYDKPYWFQNLINQGFREQQILFAIQINGYNAELVQNFLLDNT